MRPAIAVRLAFPLAAVFAGMACSWKFAECQPLFATLPEECHCDSEGRLACLDAYDFSEVMITGFPYHRVTFDDAQNRDWGRLNVGEALPLQLVFAPGRRPGAPNPESRVRAVSWEASGPALSVMPTSPLTAELRAVAPGQASVSALIVFKDGSRTPADFAACDGRGGCTFPDMLRVE